jgi:hypothetical protein
MARNIFINYRRDDEPGFTQALYSRLEQAFPPESLFMGCRQYRSAEAAMAYLRFRRSFSLGPGLKLNVGKTGVSVSSGVKGFGGTIGTTGSTLHAGVPSTGASVVSRSRKSRGRKQQEAKPNVAVMVVAIVIVVFIAVWLFH